MNEYKSYTIITVDESIALTKYGAITIPSVGRYLDGRLTTEQLKEKASKHLVELGISESSDYLMARFPIQDSDEIMGNQLINLSIFKIDGLYCLDEQACRFYETKVGGGYHYASSSLGIDIETVICESNRRRALLILSEVFELNKNEMEGFNDKVTTSRFLKELAAFKRECNLSNGDYAFLNDVVTLGITTAPYHDGGESAKFTKRYKLHKSGTNVSRESRLLNELAQAGVSNWRKILAELEARLNQNENSLHKLEVHFASIDDIAKPLFSDPKSSFTIFSFIYLKAKALFRYLAENQPDNILAELFNLYNEFIHNGCRPFEVKLAFYTLITELGWSALSDSYYRLKKLDTYQKPSPYNSMGDEVELLKKDMEIAKKELEENRKKVDELNSNLLAAQNKLESEKEKFLKKETKLKADLSAVQQELRGEQDVSHQKETELRADLSAVQQDLKSERETSQQKESELNTRLEAVQQELKSEREASQELRKDLKTAWVDREASPREDEPSQPIIKEPSTYKHPTDAQINKMKKIDLLNLCKHRGITVVSSEKVADLRKKLISWSEVSSDIQDEYVQKTANETAEDLFGN
ncbi:hypothetical protein [Endozoicomonas sp. SESOKO3]|uniref:hypothetical protein n=1 Tax=Endozoicomonas sp. SESOKO3 TaxID=2828744 RepID=UPI0021497A5C|nr:hypothetical protein [Endozoicomonas sp. SESOKO3]